MSKHLRLHHASGMVVDDTAFENLFTKLCLYSTWHMVVVAWERIHLRLHYASGMKIVCTRTTHAKEARHGRHSRQYRDGKYVECDRVSGGVFYTTSECGGT